MDPLKYIFEKPILTGNISKWQMLLTEFNIVNVVDSLVETPIDDYKPMNTAFPDKVVLFATRENDDERFEGW